MLRAIKPIFNSRTKKYNIDQLENIPWNSPNVPDLITKGYWIYSCPSRLLAFVKSNNCEVRKKCKEVMILYLEKQIENEK